MEFLFFTHLNFVIYNSLKGPWCKNIQQEDGHSTKLLVCQCVRWSSQSPQNHTHHVTFTKHILATVIAQVSVLCLRACICSVHYIYILLLQTRTKLRVMYSVLYKKCITLNHTGSISCVPKSDVTWRCKSRGRRP